MGYHILVLAGGSGTRLWPLSRQGLPKHLLPLGPGGVSLLRATVERVHELTHSLHVVTAASQVELCEAALNGINGLPDDVLIAEPSARGTGPALGLAARWILDSDPDALISSVHSDHHIQGDAAYRAALLCGAGWAEGTRGLATVGIRPTFPSTGLGYVATSGRREGNWVTPPGIDSPIALVAEHEKAYVATGFVEKPKAELAEKYLREGTYLWNLGLFSFSGRVFWDELTASDPELASQIENVVRLRREGDEAGAAAIYNAIRNVAVEPLVFEKTKELTVVEAQFQWSDLGTFIDLFQANSENADRDGNVTAQGAMTIDASNCLVESTSGRNIVLVGVEGLAVVDTADATLVVPLEKSQQVKEVVERLKQQGRSDLL